MDNLTLCLISMKNMIHVSSLPKNWMISYNHRSDQLNWLYDGTLRIVVSTIYVFT